MAVLATDVERYADPASFAREVNLPLLGVAAPVPVSPGAGLADLLAASLPEEPRVRASLDAIVENLAQTRRSLTLRSLLLAGFPHDPECFALGLALGRAWSRAGLKVAIVDLDGWNPTVVRPVGGPAEGFVDVLEYGCSFPRVAWEVVAGSLWLVGAGLHPPDEGRLTEHPDWARVVRLFAAHADVTLYVAPFLDRPGLTGRLSKRMDAVVLTASVERVGRAELRDGFLELWGSDAPIIGCVGLEPASGAIENDPFQPIAIAGRAPSPLPPPLPEIPEPLHEPALQSGRQPVPEPAPEAIVEPEAPPAARDPAITEPEEDADSRSLVSALEAEVRAGTVIRRVRRRPSKRVVWLGVGGGLALGALVAAWALFTDRGAGPVPSADLVPAGEERVLPAPDGPLPSSGTDRLGVGGEESATAAEPGAAAPPREDGSAEPPVAAGLGGVVAGTVPLTTAPPAAGKPYTVHVASFRSEEKVAPIVRQLRARGAAAWFEPAADMPGWYRVFVGRFATEDEAMVHAAFLLENEWVDRANVFSTPAR